MNSKAIRKALSIALIAAPFAILPAAVHAQAAAPAKAAPAPAAATPAAPAAAPVSSEQRAAIKELLDVLNTRESLTKTFQAMAQTLPQQMGGAMSRQIEMNTTLTPEQKVKVREGLGQPFDAAAKEAIGIVSDPKLVDQTLDKMIPIYAKYFTAAEAKQLIAFYKTPIGMKSQSSIPQANNESLQAAFVGFQPKLNALMEKTLKTQIDAATKK
ncbi:MAG: DUF2059 domain-containing protein [Burkholderiaceae bacterium]